MATLDELKTRYFVTPGNIPGGQRVPGQHDGSTVTPLVDGKDFYGDFHHEVSALTGAAVVDGTRTYRDFVYIANWNLNALCALPDPRVPGTTDLVTLLAQRAQ